MDKNKKITLSPVPMKIGLITAPGSAAYKDFTTTLEGSGFAFEIFFYPATMQGERTEPTVLNAFRILEKMDLDAICLIRGGGAKTDLVFFDSENICRAIANCPLPVLTGIGHEIDQTLADLVAHSDKITPTDCAMFLKSRAAEALEKLKYAQRSLGELWRTHVQTASGDLTSRAVSLKFSWSLRKQTENKNIKVLANEIAGLAKSIFKNEKEGLLRRKTGLLRGPFKITSPQKDYIFSIKRLLQTQWNRQLTSTKDILKLKSQLLNNADPIRQLKRGYSIIKDRNGKIVSSITGLINGAPISTETADGFIESKITSTREKI